MSEAINNTFIKAREISEEITMNTPLANLPYDKIMVELRAYRDAARYDVCMSGPRFNGWNGSQLNRARKLTEENIKEEANDPTR